MRMKLPDQPHDLSYYTTWWLTSESSISPQNTTFSGSDDNVCIDEHEEKQKTTMNEMTFKCCFPLKKFRLKWKK
ncbi:unnamed protein product [Rotaria sp. Silwood1]|nr:unnamed protein product [Rotaria sp. Silwood1]CAF0962005.1 unnamed protein product [Rotaria sp. Silwood1]CAF3402157.1 unnamed protein product [Rotaria sp. Silwood1]CAF4710447.1 unnamed protein product [Rotaria sp. Silwood1]